MSGGALMRRSGAQAATVTGRRVTPLLCPSFLGGCASLLCPHESTDFSTSMRCAAITFARRHDWSLQLLLH